MQFLKMSKYLFFVICGLIFYYMYFNFSLNTGMAKTDLKL